MLIVLGGTRKVDHLPTEIIDLVRSYVEKGCVFYVGDASGIDTAFQKLLRTLGTKKVSVCSSAEEVRNNLGSWKTEKIESPIKSKSHARHSIKDRFMTSKADLGIMVWDSKSAGTLANVIDLLEMNKESYMYNLIDQELIHFDTLKNLDGYLKGHREVQEEAVRRLHTYRSRSNRLSSKSFDQTNPQLF